MHVKREGKKKKFISEESESEKEIDREAEWEKLQEEQKDFKLEQERLAKMQPIARKKYIKKVLRKKFSEKVCKLLNKVGKETSVSQPSDETPGSILTASM